MNKRELIQKLEDFNDTDEVFFEDQRGVRMPIETVDSGSITTDDDRFTTVVLGRC